MAAFNLNANTSTLVKFLRDNRDNAKVVTGDSIQAGAQRLQFTDTEKVEITQELAQINLGAAQVGTFEDVLNHAQNSSVAFLDALTAAHAEVTEATGSL